MKILVSGGNKTENIIKALESKFKSSGVEFIIVPYIEDIASIYQRGEYFDRAIIIEQCWNHDFSDYDETNIRRRINDFALDTSDRNLQNASFVFLAQDEHSATIASEEILSIKIDSIVCVKQPKYSVNFFAFLITAEFSEFPEEIVYNDEPEESIGAPEAVTTDESFNSEFNQSELEEDPNNWDNANRLPMDTGEFQDNIGNGEGTGDYLPLDSEFTGEDLEQGFEDTGFTNENTLDGNGETVETGEVSLGNIEDSDFGGTEFSLDGEGASDFDDIPELGETDAGVTDESSENGDYIPQNQGVQSAENYDSSMVNGEQDVNSWGNNGNEFDSIGNLGEGLGNPVEDYESVDDGLMGPVDDTYDNIPANIENLESVDVGTTQLSGEIPDYSSPYEEPQDIPDEQIQGEYDETYDETYDDGINDEVVDGGAEDTSDYPEEADYPSDTEYDGPSTYVQPSVETPGFSDQDYADSVIRPEEEFDDTAYNNNQAAAPKANRKALQNDMAKATFDAFASRGNSIVVTGCGGCGTSTVAMNLANTICNMGYNVLLVDMDTMNKTQSYISKEHYESIDHDAAAVVAAINSTNGITAYEAIVRQGYHILTMGMAADTKEPSDVFNPDRLSRFSNMAKSAQNFIIYDVPFNDAVNTLSPLLINADNIVITIDASSWGIVKTMLSMCNINDDDVRDIVFSKGQLLLNRYRGIHTLLGRKVKSAPDIAKAMDKQVKELIGEDPGNYFSSMHICGIIRDDPAFEDGWFNNVQYSDTQRGNAIFIEVLKKIVLHL